MNFLVEGSLPNIKQEVSTDPTFRDRFISVIKNIDHQYPVSKDSIFQWIRLFDENASQFLDLFQKSFLLIFKSYTDLSNPIIRRPPEQVAKRYSQLLDMFVSALVDLTAEVKLNQEKKEQIKDFIEFQLLFFSEGLTAGKNFLKQFCFQMVSSSLKNISHKLDISFQPQTQNQLLGAVFYLLASKSEDHKRMGIQIYAALKTFGITSSQINQISFKNLEQIQNYTIRRSLIRSGIDLYKQGTLDRLLNRLRDRNPLIAEEVVQKLIDESFPFQDMKFQQKIKLIVDGFGSPHLQIKQRTIKYFRNQLNDMLNRRESDIQEGRNQEKEVRLKTLNKSLSLSMSKSKNLSFLEEKRNLTGIQKLVRIFSSDQYETEDYKIFQENPFLSSLLCGLIYEIATDVMPLNRIVEEIHKIFTQVELYSLKTQHCIFLYCLLRGVCQNKSVGEDLSALETRKKLRQFILKTDMFPNAQIFISYLIKLLQETDYSSRTIKLYLLKVIQLLTVHLSIYDCVGVRVFYNQFIKILTEFTFLKGLFKEKQSQNNQDFKSNQNRQHLKDQNNQDPKSDQNKQYDNSNDNFMYLQLMKANQLLNNKKSNTAGRAMPELDIVTGQLDLIFTITEIIHKILAKEPTCERGQLKLLISQLIESKNLKLEKQTLINMRIKTANQIQNISEINLQCSEVKSYSNLVQLTKQVEKKLQQNQRIIVSRILKAFFILVKTLSIKEGQSKSGMGYLKDFEASNYYEAVKAYIQSLADNANFSTSGYLQTCWIPYMFFYYKAYENFENFITFKKLFIFYAFRAESSLCEKDNLLRLINIRFLVQLELKYSPQNFLLNKTQNNQDQAIQKVLNSLVSHKVNHPIEEHFLKQIILKVLTFMPSPQQTDSLLCNIFLFKIKQFLTDESEEVFSRIFTLVFRSIALNDLSQGFNKVMLFYCVLAKFIEEQKAVLKRQDKHLIFWYGIKQFKILLHFIKSQKYDKLYQQNFQTDLFQLTIILKVAQIIPQKLLTPLTCYLSLEKLTNEKFDDQQIETLIFAKSSIEKYLEKLQQNQIERYHSIETEFINLSSLLEIIDEKIGDVIFQRLKPEENDLFQQQSTNPSPDLNTTDKNAKASTNSPIEKVNFEKIEIYKEDLSNKINAFKQQAYHIYQSIKSSNLFKSLSKDFLQFVAKYKANHSAESLKKGGIKIEEEHQSQSNTVVKVSELDLNQVKFDRKGRRKLTDSERLKNINKMKGSVKKSRYLIIPYDLVETAEQKYDKKSNSKKKSRKGSANYNDNRSHYTSLRLKGSYSQQISNQQASSHQQSAENLTNHK